jgi:hypothetical protein
VAPKLFLHLQFHTVPETAALTTNDSTSHQPFAPTGLVENQLNFPAYTRGSSYHVERVTELHELLRNNGVDSHADIVAAQDRWDWA